MKFVPYRKISCRCFVVAAELNLYSPADWSESSENQNWAARQLDYVIECRWTSYWVGRADIKETRGGPLKLMYPTMVEQRVSQHTFFRAINLNAHENGETLKLLEFQTLSLFALNQRMLFFSDFIPSVKNELCIHKIYMLLFRECAWFWQKIVIKCEERRILEFHIFAFSISTRAIGAEVSDLMILMVGRVKRFFFASVGWARLQYRILEREKLFFWGFDVLSKTPFFCFCWCWLQESFGEALKRLNNSRTRKKN